MAAGLVALSLVWQILSGQGPVAGGQCSVITNRGPAAGGEGSVPITVVDEGTLSGIDERRQVVVRTAEEWRALWREHAGGGRPPEVDFDRRTVLAVFAGSRPTAGWSISIRGVTPEGEGVRVAVAESRPAGDQIAAQILTAPFQIVSVPRFTGPAVFSGSR
jgi:hypothetical protein